MMQEMALLESMETQEQTAPRGSRTIWIRASVAAAGLLGAAALASHTFPGAAHHFTRVSSNFVQLSQDGFPGFPNDAGQPSNSAWGVNMQSQASQETSFTPSQSQGALQRLTPKENLHDDNPCGDDEELFEALCYSKCSILTGGMKPVRCAAHICEPLNQNGQHKCELSRNAIESVLSSPSLMPCHGYDVAGTREGKKRCPHPPGICLKDEELYLGTCFKKCNILTNGAFPHRKAFATCCKADSLFQCLMPGQAKTDQAFAEGGGFGDHDPNTPAQAHAPMESLTESR
eukprot:CAMPEP_0181455512 /NCGR_PEP_ID=MMETSP1110-20121109/30797_1 /TAXON_ID=174948 /ORGANISM="Symbiodinium sp., Strain CCMP421" /LENGTH=287 /DNA_ID=CAMNT_0023579901 /DNA_START=64 /DNA_END=927 /DNA_ORIENTATION=+